MHEIALHHPIGKLHPQLKWTDTRGNVQNADLFVCLSGERHD